jgi:hypothetical protein
MSISLNCVPPRLACLSLALAVWTAAPLAWACGDMDFRGEAVTIQRDLEQTTNGAQGAIQVIGAGWFHAAEIVKEGGSSDLTNVVIELDGVEMLSTSFATLKNAWMQIDTHYFMANVRTEGTIDRMTIWYAPELKFRGIMAVRIDVQEDKVQSVRVRAVLNKPAPHEHLAGQTNASALPAFK